MVDLMAWVVGTTQVKENLLGKILRIIINLQAMVQYSIVTQRYG
jgi:hypothetical protein